MHKKNLCYYYGRKSMTAIHAEHLGEFGLLVHGENLKNEAKIIVYISFTALISPDSMASRNSS
jgi:hypothetical protein